MSRCEGCIMVQVMVFAKHHRTLVESVQMEYHGVVRAKLLVRPLYQWSILVLISKKRI